MLQLIIIRFINLKGSGSHSSSGCGDSLMLGHLFFFQGRIGRLRYFLWGWVFVPVALLLTLLILPLTAVFSPGLWASKTMVMVILFPPMAAVFWMETSLQAARIRDIGWKPGVVIPILLAINVADKILAYLFPTLVIDLYHGTIISTVVNIVVTLVLFFTPTDGDEMVPFIIPGLSLPKVSLEIFRRNRPEAPVYSKPRQLPSEAPPPRYPHEKVPFGRRGLT